VEKWEYKIVAWPTRLADRGITAPELDANVEAQINQLGGDGWELTGVISNVRGSAVGILTDIKFVFKRRKP
jgi:hypothetical protein